MSIYDDAARSTSVRNLQKRAQKHPAKALYAYWLSVLDGATTGSANTGARFSLRLGDAYLHSYREEFGHPVLDFGHFTINVKGEFQLLPMHGAHQRNIVSASTFLQYSYFRSTYNWWVNPILEKKGYHWNTGDLEDWRKPVHYVSEATIRAKKWDRPWLKLLPEGDGWKIGLAHHKSIDPVTQADFDRFEALRQRRYSLMERREKVRTGEWDAQGRPRPTTEQIKERQAKSVSVLMAHLDVSQPARTVPLRKTPEEEGLWQLSGSH